MNQNQENQKDQQNKKDILPIVVFGILAGIIFIAGGIFAWQYFEAPRKEALKEVEILETPKEIEAVFIDRGSILLQKNDEKIQIYSLEQWAEWAEENWEGWDRLRRFTRLAFGFDFPLYKVTPERISERLNIRKAILCPNKEEIVFVFQEYQALSHFSIIGILDIDTQEVSIIKGESDFMVEEINWSPNKKYIVYTLSSPIAWWELYVYNVVDQKRVFNLSGREIGIDLLGFEARMPEGPPGFLIDPKIKEIEWSLDSERIYFITYLSEELGQVWEMDPGIILPAQLRWVINADGTGLRKIDH